MNLSELLTMVKMDIGIYMVPLPFENSDKVLFDVIKMKSLRTFSNLFPHKMEFVMDLKDLEVIRETYDEKSYRLPTLFGDRPIISVIKVDPYSSNYTGNYFGGNPIITNSANLYEDTMLGALGYDLLSTVAPPFTFRFTAPSTLTLYNIGTFADKIKIQLAYGHAENLSTIKPTMEDSFYELVKLDIKSFLYNNLKHYNTIQTSFATLNLMIDEWSGAEQERRELVERWTDEYHLEVDQFVII